MSFPEPKSWVWWLWREVWALAAAWGIPVPHCQLHTVLLLSPPRRQTVKAGQEPRAGPRSPAQQSPYASRSAGPHRFPFLSPTSFPFSTVMAGLAHSPQHRGTPEMQLSQLGGKQGALVLRTGVPTAMGWPGTPECPRPRTGLISRQPLHSQKRSESTTEAELRGNFQFPCQPPVSQAPCTEGPIFPLQGSSLRPNLATVVSSKEQAAAPTLHSKAGISSAS